MPCILTVALVACGSGVDGPQEATPDTEQATEGANDSGSEDFAAFCDGMTRLGDERPEEYVGSSEHLKDIEGLAAVAPTEVRSDVQTYRHFIASGAIAADEPDSNLTGNWPPEIQGAIARISDLRISKLLNPVTLARCTSAKMGLDATVVWR